MSPGVGPQPSAYIHYDPERTDYAVTKEELAVLRQGGGGIWKDTSLVAAGLAFPTLVNAITEVSAQEKFILTLPMFLNFLVGAIALAVAIVCGLAWRRSHVNFKSVVEGITRKPRMRIIPEAVNVGPVQSTNAILTLAPPEGPEGPHNQQ